MTAFYDATASLRVDRLEDAIIPKMARDIQALQDQYGPSKAIREMMKLLDSMVSKLDQFVGPIGGATDTVTGKTNDPGQLAQALRSKMSLAYEAINSVVNNHLTSLKIERTVNNHRMSPEIERMFSGVHSLFKSN